MRSWISTLFPLLLLSSSSLANEVGLESAGPTRFGAVFPILSEQRVGKFNGDHGLSAAFQFKQSEETSVGVLVSLKTGAQAKLKGRIGGQSIDMAITGTDSPEWLDLGKVRIPQDKVLSIEIDAGERRGGGSVMLHKFRFSSEAAALPMLALNTAYRDGEGMKGNRRGVTFTQVGGSLLIPVQVDKPGLKKLSLAFQSQDGATANFAVESRFGGQVIGSPLEVAVTGTGKNAESKSFALNFPQAGTYLIAVTPKALSAELTLERLLLQACDNSDLWSLPNANSQSVHFGYPIPKGETAVWAYAEATSMPGPAHTYNCVLGFSQGYFGFQRRGTTTALDDRWFIYSLWDNGFIKKSSKKDGVGGVDNSVVRLINKGSDAEASAFDHEGSGGHSHLAYPWQDKKPYGFLLGVKPDGDGAIFTTYVRLPETLEWKLIASFRRPKTEAKIDGLYSFVEDWTGAYGQKERVCSYRNLWVQNPAGKWLPLLEAHSSATQELGRSDFSHKIVNDSFVLSTGGYGPAEGRRDQILQLPAGVERTPPQIDLARLPVK